MFNSGYDNYAPATNTALSHTDPFAGSKLVSTTNSFPEVLEHATLRRPLAPKFLMLHNSDWRKNLLHSDLEWQFKQLKKSKDSIHLNCYKGWVDGECRMELLDDLCCYNLGEKARAFSHNYEDSDKLASDRMQAVFGRLDEHPEPICIVRVRRDDDAEDLYYVPAFFFYRAACREDADDIDICYFNLTYIGAANIYFHSLTADEKAAPAIDWYYKTMTYIMLENGLATNEGYVMDDRFDANKPLLEQLEMSLDAKRKSSDCEDKLSLTDEEHKKNSERFQKRKNQIKKARKKEKRHLEHFIPLDDDAEFDSCNRNNEDTVIETTCVIKEDEDSGAKKLSYTEMYRTGTLTFGGADNAAEEKSSACVTPITQTETSPSNISPDFDETVPVFTTPDIPDDESDAIVTAEELVNIKKDPMTYAQEALSHIRLFLGADKLRNNRHIPILSKSHNEQS